MKKLLKSVIVALVLAISACSLFACGDNSAESKTVYLKYYSDAAEIIPALRNGAVEIGLLPEPAATRLTSLSAEYSYRIDLQEEYDSVNKAYPQAVMAVKESVLTAHPEIVNAIKENFDTNITWVQNNIADAVGAVNSALAEGVTPSLSAAALTSSAIDGCNIYWQSATDAKTQVNNYISALQSVESVAANTVGDDFFYEESSSEAGTSEVTYKVYAPDGAPALSIAKYIFDGTAISDKVNFEYHIVSSTVIGAQMSQGNADIIIIPINAASKLYKANSTDPYKVVSVVTHGNLFIMSKQNLTLSDLAGKTVGVIGQGLVPDLTLKAVLKVNNINVEIAV